MKDAGKLVRLYILETEEKLRAVTPSTSHLAKWKNWIATQAAKVVCTRDAEYYESFKWAETSSVQRQTLIRDIREQYNSKYEEDDHLALLAGMDHIFENCQDMMADGGLPQALLIDEKRLEKIYSALQLPSSWDHFLSSLRHSNPALRVLEIGAGTGRATREVLRNLKPWGNVRFYSQYTFTDNSQEMLDAAAKGFSLEEAIEFKMLDISEDPEAQGFQPHSFDLVIASHVIHRTPCLKASLRNGTLPDWWIGAEDNRIDQPYVSPQRWDTELRAAGFTGNDATTYDLDPPYHCHFTMLSRVMPTSDTKRDILLLTNGVQSQIAKTIAYKFLDHGCTINWGTLDDTPPTDYCVVSLLDLDDPYLYNMSESDYTKSSNGLDKSRIWIQNTSSLSTRGR
ncbi:hypothetical protein EYZ11_000909 [Aspergillus tanneri]|uniref:Methyltransferase type 12 domain-containing protein n=1 Tax=Aspergillus tanneri TaxID=1220188 RepID=A0A4S3JW06_9EURO|nr:hypothetical protein EYZ11_000909 [Aspergillus tanneri]